MRDKVLVFVCVQEDFALLLTAPHVPIFDFHLPHHSSSIFQLVFHSAIVLLELLFLHFDRLQYLQLIDGMRIGLQHGMKFVLQLLNLSVCSQKFVLSLSDSAVECAQLGLELLNVGFKD
jgi:hypothetical protein